MSRFFFFCGDFLLHRIAHRFSSAPTTRIGPEMNHATTEEIEEELRQQHGGKQIGEGMYSCIFLPNLACKPNTTHQVSTTVTTTGNQPMVTKLMDTEHAEAEYQISQKIARLPLWRNYFVISESICQPAPQQTDPDLPSCHRMEHRTLGQMRLLSMPFRGQSLYRFQFDMTAFDPMAFLLHLIEAGALLTLYGIVHRDLHQGNFLIDDQMVPRLIDFNLSIAVKTEVSVHDLMHTYDPELMQEPPDSALITGLVHGYRAERLIPDIIRRKKILRTVIDVLGGSLEDMEDDLEAFYENSKAMSSEKISEWFRVYWRVIDSWAIGVILVDLLHKWSMWPRFQAVFRGPTRNRVMAVLRGMCAVHPMKRIDCVQALAQLDPKHFLVRKYGKEWISRLGLGAAMAGTSFAP